MPAKRRTRESVPEAAKPIQSDRPIRDWIKDFQKLYAPADKKRSPVEMWVAATAHFTIMGEAIRRMHFSKLMKAAAHAFCWMSSFVLRCRGEKNTVFAVDESFCSIVAAKYPFVCGHCKERYCHCNPQLMDAQDNKAATYKDLLVERSALHGAYEDYSVSDWLSTFERIYGQHIHMLTLESIGFHFLEEAGEELTALRALLQLKHAPEQNLTGVDGQFLAQLATSEGAVRLYGEYAKQKLEPDKHTPQAIRARLVHAKVAMFIELADTFSWFCSIINKVMAIAKNCGDDKCQFIQQPFRQWLQQEYLLDAKLLCPTCRKCPCECVFYN